MKWITREHVKGETIPSGPRSATLAVSAKFCLRYNPLFALSSLFKTWGPKV